MVVSKVKTLTKISGNGIVFGDNLTGGIKVFLIAFDLILFLTNKALARKRKGWDFMGETFHWRQSPPKVSKFGDLYLVTASWRKGS
jgi:hypothetical protein